MKNQSGCGILLLVGLRPRVVTVLKEMSGLYTWKGTDRTVDRVGSGAETKSFGTTLTVPKLFVPLWCLLLDTHPWDGGEGGYQQLQASAYSLGNFSENKIASFSQ